MPKQVRELAAVADFAIGQMDAGVQGRVGVQAGRGRQALRRVRNVYAPIRLAQQGHGRFRERQFLRTAQQPEAAIGKFVAELEVMREFV